MGVGLYAGHATQPESTVSMTAICQRRSLCEPHSAWTISRLLAGYVDAWGRALFSGVLNDHAHTFDAAAAAQPAIVT